MATAFCLCGDEIFTTQAIEEIKEGCARLLIDIEAEKTALGHVVDAFQLATQVGVGVPPGG